MIHGNDSEITSLIMTVSGFSFFGGCPRCSLKTLFLQRTQWIVLSHKCLVMKEEKEDKWCRILLLAIL